MERELVFISHITEESELAIEIKEIIKTAFLGMIDVFVSSDGESIGLGQLWLSEIRDNLKKCSVEIILCSEKSIKRPWINFEAGAGWIKDIPVIPICHSGMTKANLPTPINSLQSIEISDFEKILPILAKALNCQVPQINLDTFKEKILQLEYKYKEEATSSEFWINVNKCFQKINNFHKEIIPTLKEQEKVDLTVVVDDFKDILKDLYDFLIPNGIVRCTPHDVVVHGISTVDIGRFGFEKKYYIELTEKGKEIIKDKRFKF
ncbi:TPA: toll/interleukin-1 receptor domain-containing protein [Clostridioides difficile]|nr:toll/interleukin-1 receptor domain-containing protein [Clostridioides difficile]HBF7547489.1 toll/interleukin-1 receptor domain-containing protein [Clostridioides difficile]HBF8167809.1 toll/interleukin-1 receptor domain-containing protein [Clostridioides difficile]